MYEMPKIPNALGDKIEVAEIKKVEPKIISWGTINGCDFVYESNGMLTAKINEKWKIIYQYAEPDEVINLKSKFRTGKITKEDLLNNNYGE